MEEANGPQPVATSETQMSWLRKIWSTITVLIRLSDLDARVGKLDRRLRETSRERQEIFNIGSIGTLDIDIENITRETIIQQAKLEVTRRHIYTSNVAHTGHAVGLSLALCYSFEDEPERLERVADRLEEWADSYTTLWRETETTPAFEKMGLSEESKQKLRDQRLVHEMGVRSVSAWIRSSVRSLQK